jgi:hypothetical protein
MLPIRSTRTPYIKIANEILTREFSILHDQKSHGLGADIKNRDLPTYG